MKVIFLCWQSRPFGVALLIAGWDEAGGPLLYHTDPSGTFSSATAMAIGSGSEGAQTTLEEEYKPDLSFEEAETLALSTLKQVMEEKVKAQDCPIIISHHSQKSRSCKEAPKVLSGFLTFLLLEDASSLLAIRRAKFV